MPPLKQRPDQVLWSREDRQRVSAARAEFFRLTDRGERTKADAARGKAERAADDADRRAREHFFGWQREHAEAHDRPSHHVGPCDDACRRGMRAHRHRVPGR